MSNSKYDNIKKMAFFLKENANDLVCRDLVSKRPKYPNKPHLNDYQL
jgi:hypothetical protein